MVKRKRLRIQLTVCLIMSVVFGLLDYLVLIVPVANIRSASEWGQTECVVESVERDVKIIEGEEGSRVSKVFNVTYSYEYDGKVYRSCRYSFFGNASSYLLAEPSVGAKMKCFINPKQPNEAVIYREFPKRSLWYFVFGLLLSGCFLYGVFDAVKKMRAMNK